MAQVILAVAVVSSHCDLAYLVEDILTRDIVVKLPTCLKPVNFGCQTWLRSPHGVSLAWADEGKHGQSLGTRGQVDARMGVHGKA